MASVLRKHHLLIGGLLLALAVVLYLVGFHFGAVVVTVIAVIVEITAWVTLAGARTEDAIPPKDDRAGPG